MKKEIKHRLSRHQATYLILIYDHCPSPDGSFWVPPDGYKRSYSSTLKHGDIFVDGAGVAQTLKSLERKGLIEFMPQVSKYSSKITEEGRFLIEAWRENNAWPVEVNDD